MAREKKSTPTPTRLKVWPDREAAFYVRGLEQSDYSERIGGKLVDRLGSTNSLLDVGAGSGILGEGILEPGGDWWGVEPNDYMVKMLRRAMKKRPGPGQRRILHDVWENLSSYHLPSFETVLCANMPGFFTEPARMWEMLYAHAETVMCWVVSAQKGPSSYCLSGFLPPRLHREDVGPAYKQTLQRLSTVAPKPECSFAEYEFEYRFSSVDEAKRHFRDKGGYERGAKQTLDIESYLVNNLTRANGEFIASAPKRCAFLTWEK